MINFLTNLICTICESNTILDNITSLGMSDEAYYSYKKAEQAQKTEWPVADDASKYPQGYKPKLVKFGKLTPRR